MEAGGDTGEWKSPSHDQEITFLLWFLRTKPLFFLPALSLLTFIRGPEQAQLVS